MSVKAPYLAYSKNKCDLLENCRVKLLNKIAANVSIICILQFFTKEIIILS